MRIELVRYGSMPNRIYKYNYIDYDNSLVLNGEFKNDVDLMYPSIIIENSLNGVPQDLSLWYNYCIITDNVGHTLYYFINNIVYMNKNNIELQLELDVLSTYRTKIYNFNVILSRHESLYNMNIQDNLLPFTKNYNTSITFGGVGEFELSPTIDNWYDSYSYFITIVCDDVGNLDSTKVSNIPTMRTFLCGLEDIQSITHRLISVDISSFFTAFFENDRSACVTSILYIPVKPNTSLGVTFKEDGKLENRVAGIPLGKGDLRGFDEEYGFGVNSLNCNYMRVYGGRVYLFNSSDNNVITKVNLKFYELTPMSKYEMYIPFYGWLDIDVNKLNEKTHILSLEYYINLLNGMAIVKVIEQGYSDVASSIISYQEYCVLNCQVGIQIPLGSFDGNNIFRNIASTVVNTTSSIISGGISLVAGKSAVDVLGGITETSGALKALNVGESHYNNIVNTAKNTISNVFSGGLGTTTSGQIKGSFEILGMGLRPLLKSIIPQALDYELYNRSIGRPSTYNGTIGDLPNGEYAVASSVIVEPYEYDNPIPFNALDKILTILKSGFYK